MSIAHEQHAPGLTDELGQRAMQGLAALATLGEAAARLRAEHLRRQEREQQIAAEQDTARRKALTDERELHDQAARLQAAKDRRAFTRWSTGDWIDRADIYDLGVAWRLTRLREGQPGFDAAEPLAGRVEDRLREMYPGPMRLYDQQVAEGVPRHVAMRVAAGVMATTPAFMREHGPDAPDPGEAPRMIGEAGFAQGVDDEQAHLRRGMTPDTQRHYDQLLDEIGALSPNAAAIALEIILGTRAREDTRAAAGDAATLDDPRTPVDERTTASADQTGQQGAANRDTAAAAGQHRAAQLAAQAYPQGWYVVPTREPGRGVTPPPGLADKSPVVYGRPGDVQPKTPRRSR